MKSAFDGKQRRNARKRWNWARALLRPQTAKVLIGIGKALANFVKLVLFLKDTFGS